MTRADNVREVERQAHAIAKLNAAYGHGTDPGEYVEDDPGTVRWFGRSWSAPVCDPRTHIATPVGSVCPFDGADIEDGDRGISVVSPDGRAAFHLACFLYSVGAR